MDNNNILDILYKFALIPLSVVFWWFFKKVDYRLERNELSSDTIQKEFGLRMQTIEKALELRVQNLEKTVVVITTRLDSIKEALLDIKEAQKETMDILAKMRNLKT